MEEYVGWTDLRRINYDNKRGTFTETTGTVKEYRDYFSKLRV